MAFLKDKVEGAVKAVLDDGSRLQAPTVNKYVNRVRRSHPNESPAEIIERLYQSFCI